MRVLVTGANGFVGGALVRRLQQAGQFIVRAGQRQAPSVLDTDIEYVSTPALDGQANWMSALEKVDVVVHCAARVHVMNETALDPLAEFRRANVDGSLALARQAVKAGVRRFVYVSTIKVNGESTELGRPYSADDTPVPTDPYGITKLEAERQLLALSNTTGLEVTIVRPVLVYGPGVQANFLRMMAWLDKGVPLPFGAVANLRSLVSVHNLADLLTSCVSHPAAANQVFLVSDGEDLSTTDLMWRLSEALGRPANLLPVSVSFMRAAARLVGKDDLAQRLFGSLQVNIDKTCQVLGWAPPFSVGQGLRLTAEAFKQRASLSDKK